MHSGDIDIIPSLSMAYLSCLGLASQCFADKTLLHPAMQLKELGLMLQVKGHVEDSGTVLPHPRLHGRWDASLHATHANGSQETLFTASLPHKHPSRWVFRMLTISFESFVLSSLKNIITVKLETCRHQSRGLLSTE